MRIAVLVACIAATGVPHVFAETSGSADLYEELEEYLNPELPPLHSAVWDGDRGEVERLLAAGVDVGATVGRWGTPLHIAAYHGRAEIVDLLLDAGAEVLPPGDQRQKARQTVSTLAEALDAEQRERARAQAAEWLEHYDGGT